jgi:hypothetical protein
MPTKDMGVMIDRRSLFVGGAVAVSVGSVPAVEASEAELSERLPSFEFLGHRIGDSIHEIFPAPAEDGSKGRPYCMNVAGRAFCYGDPKIWFGSGCTVGGVSVKLTYGLLNGKLATLTMIFDSESYQTLREMLIGKYGQPTYENFDFTFRGVHYQGNRFSHWLFREGLLVLTEVPKTGVLHFHQYTVTQEPQDPEAIQLRMLGKRTF